VYQQGYTGTLGWVSPTTATPLPNIAGIPGTWHTFLLPFIEQSNVFQQIKDNNPQRQGNVGWQNMIKTYVCPSDPSAGLCGTYATWAGAINRGSGWDRQSPDTYKPPLGATNYAPNAWVFNPVTPGTITTAMQRGTSQTIIIAEIYQCCNLALNATYTGNGGFNGASWAHRWDIFQGGRNNPSIYGCPTAKIWIPGYPHTTEYNWRDYQHAGVNFQIAPPPDRVAPPPNGPGCHFQVTQTPHPGGMVVTLGDGSVRVLGPGIASNNNNVWLIANNPGDTRVLPADWN
jgi:hypothetical protein